MRDVLTFILVHYWFWILLGAFFVFCFISIFLVACWEKHPIRQYQPGAPEEVGPPSGYFRAMNESAAKRNLIHAGNYLQKRDSSLYKCCISLWLTPDLNTLIAVFGGKMAKIDYKWTIFTSVTTDGGEIVTMDNFGISDASGIREIEVVWNADFEELFIHHEMRLSKMEEPLKPFTPSRALDQYEDLGRIRAERMAALGLAKFLEISEANWRYTVKGALARTYASYVMGTLKAKQQKDRQFKKRPGS